VNPDPIGVLDMVRDHVLVRPNGEPPAPFAGRRLENTSFSDGIGVIHLTSEYWPLARTGGLGEAVSGLANIQAASGMPTIVVMPLYQAIRESSIPLEPVGGPFTVVISSTSETVRLFRLIARGRGPQVYLIDHPMSFDRANIYGDAAGDYPDNARRFAVFVRAALATLPTIAPSGRVVHAHDWHAALAPLYLRTVLRGDAYYDGLATVLSVHNAGFQGHLGRQSLGDLGLSETAKVVDALEWYGRLNLLKAGVTFADSVITVSPSHAGELCTVEGAFGLHDTFRALGNRLSGILNGIDLERWNPETDPVIAAPFSLYDLAGKRRCKAALQRSYGLTEHPGIPLIGMSSRLVTQKGLDLVLGSSLVATSGAQFVFLGHGERRFEDALTELARTSPSRIGVELAFTDRGEHELIAGADLLLMPSMYEPCGLAQMRAQRYGTVPLARRTGGLADTIEDGITGFMFDEYTPGALDQAARRALTVYSLADQWVHLVRMGMRQRFGWRRAGRLYHDAYHRALALLPTARVG
jgi:starch synthase